MTRHEAIARLMRGVGQDVRDYRALHDLFDSQFDAALRHDGGVLERLASQITALVDGLEARRVERVGVIALLAGAHAEVSDAFELLHGRPREVLESGWQELQGLVHDCKQLNHRNGELLMDQQDIMRRVTHGPESIYEPR
jgi:flagella synthesis protein FlgN